MRHGVEDFNRVGTSASKGNNETSVIVDCNDCIIVIIIITIIIIMLIRRRRRKREISGEFTSESLIEKDTSKSQDRRDKRDF